MWFKRNTVVVEEYVNLQERLRPYVTVDVVAAEAADGEPEAADLTVVTLA